MKFVPVPITGGPTGGQRVLFSIWETRVQDYGAFVQDIKVEWAKGGIKAGPTDPAAHMTWDDAQAFCAWLTARERRAGKIGPGERYRLPTSHEWSCAVGIGDREDPAKLPAEKNKKIADVFPWGTQWPPPPGAGNYKGEERAGPAVPNQQAAIVGYRDDFQFAAPVGSFPANPLGIFDLGGNVWEWCEDWFDQSRKTVLVRGQSYEDAYRDWLLSSSMAASEPSAHHPNRGFRVVLAPAP
jgi:formylglycine-generating enzyme required for sulfatase activity